MNPRIFPWVALPLISAACSQSATEKPATTPTEIEAQRQKAAQEFRLEYSNPARLDSLSTYQYQLVGLAGQQGRSSSRLDSYGSSYSSESYESGSNFNIAFFHPDGTDAHLLLPHSRFRITDFDAKLWPQARTPYLFYNIITADTNHDGRQDSDDAEALFASDREGRHLWQVTPDSTYLLSWKTLEPHYLVVQLRFYSARFAHSSTADAIQWLRYDLRTLHAPPVPLLPAAMQKTLQQHLIDRRLQLPNEG
ncbi:hypothetical protein [Hymenobacter sp. CRA2]|uniref:hypothetical protein n=1 Tax=Hymenobacter sp. CRA2 TaxID=1955620 RepID=UPI00098F8277|nr:hypothetical protein [Hymenobacter sp. CRA2]OON68814.1 hypothetical protein B0919_11560 [Hymenobacter sp. CRA2]